MIVPSAGCIRCKLEQGIIRINAVYTFRGFLVVILVVYCR